MRQIEIGLGGLLMLVAAALAAGLADHVVRLPPIGFGATLAVLTLGAVLVAHGVIGLRLRTDGAETTRLRVHGRTAFAVLLTAAMGLAVPALVAPLNLFSIAGFPGGFYLAAQGALVALAILAFRSADGLDAAEGPDAEPTAADGEP